MGMRITVQPETFQLAQVFTISRGSRSQAEHWREYFDALVFELINQLLGVPRHFGEHGGRGRFTDH